MASDTGQSDSQGWSWQKVKRAGKFVAAAGTFYSGGLSGSVLGLAIGTVILPVVGTVIGFYAGGILGAHLGARLAVYILDESDYTPYERHLIEQSWMPFGIQKVDVGPEGGTIILQSKADSGINFEIEDVIQLEVPKDAVRKQGGGKLPIRYGVLVDGKFQLKAGYKLASPVVYVSYDQKDITKPLKLLLPHWSSDEDVFIATAHQDDKNWGGITFNFKDETVSSSSRNAVVSSVSGSELYAVAVREGSKSKFYAIPHEIPIKNGRGVELSVIISYASGVWCEILCELYFPDGNFPYPCPVFKFLDSFICPRLARDGGPGWKAKLCGYSEIGLKHIDKDSHDILDGNELIKAVISKRYPPRFVCEVNWSAEAEAHGKRRQVGVFIEGSNPELSFSCLTFEAPVPGPTNVHGSNSVKGSCSHVKARDALHNFYWFELRNRVKDMLTKSRVDTLERQYKLIDSSCNAKIRSDLERGDQDSAVTTLIEYFEANHNGDGILRFCEFLRDEAVEAERNAMLEDLADRIERVVRRLEAILGIITDTDEFLLYTDKMIPHLTLLGTVLGIEDFATAIVNGPGDPQTKCLKILKQWLDVTPNPTWDLFCENLRKSPTFNNLKSRIAEDHDASGLSLG